jgi:hypothetical protein
MLRPPMRATLILSVGKTAPLAQEIESKGINEPAAITDAVFMKFLRVDAILNLFIVNNWQGNIKLYKGQY